MESEATERRWRMGLRTLYLAACACVLFGVGSYLRSPNLEARRGTQTKASPAFTPSVSATPAPQLAPGVVWVNTATRIYHLRCARFLDHGTRK